MSEANSIGFELAVSSPEPRAYIGVVYNPTRLFVRSVFHRALAGSVLGLAFVILAGCGAPGIGGKCKIDDPNACQDGLVCEDGGSGTNICVVPAGGECDPDRKPPGCFDGGECLISTAVDKDGNPIYQCGLVEGSPCEMADDRCGPGLDCSERTDGTFACHEAFFFTGIVSDALSGDPIEGAHIIGLDAKPVAVTDIAVSEADGRYELHVPTLRDLDGTILAASYTLRAGAQMYETFPGGIRTALPIDTSTAVQTDDGWMVETALTDITLIPLADQTTARVTVSGTVVADELSAGVLVAAEQAGTFGLTALSDRNGAYTIFNVPAGDFEVRGYRAGLQLNPAAITVADADLTDVDLTLSDGALGSVSGSLNPVDALGGATVTSVILVPLSTFDPVVGRGELPLGLRVTGIDSTNTFMFTIPNVPAGQYVVLAAFDSDQLVRDPDSSQAGTGFVTFEMMNADITLTQSFKITKALEIFSPGATGTEEIASGTPITLSWAFDAGANHYEVRVFDANGTIAWENLNVPQPGSNAPISITYEGPTEVGMYYQLRATSVGAGGAPISMTEDLLGVFTIIP